MFEIQYSLIQNLFFILLSSFEINLFVFGFPSSEKIWSMSVSIDFKPGIEIRLTTRYND